MEPRTSAEGPEVPVVALHRLRGVTNASDVDAVIWCVNLTPHTFHVWTRSESFTTADERTGAVVLHGPPPASRTVRPGETAELGEVRGWEWDGVVALVVAFQREGSPEPLRASYTFTGGGPRERMEIPGVGEAWIAPPFWLRPR